MKRLIILVIAIGACAVVDVGNGDRSDVRGAQQDESSSEPSPALATGPEAALTCDGSPGQWPGCRGNGCAVCAELVGNAPCYFANHPSCVPNTTCNGEYFECNDACPQPTFADFCLCGNGPCTGGETCESCPADCGPCPCGNGTCGGGETCESCPADCGSCCGNGTCDGSENCDTCPADCGGGSGTCADGSPCCGQPCRDGSFCM
jgi:hypothetical protein